MDPPMRRGIFIVAGNLFWWHAPSPAFEPEVIESCKRAKSRFFILRDRRRKKGEERETKSASFFKNSITLFLLIRLFDSFIIYAII